MQRIDSEEARLIDLIRHGMPVGGRRYRGHRDDPLAAEGWQQMWSAVGAHCPWTRVVTSPLARCRAFAEALADREGLACTVEPGFKEISFGEWEGREVHEILAETPEQITRYWADPVANTPPGGESLEAFRARVVAAWETLTADDHAHTLVVGHGGLIRMLVGHVLGLPLASVLRVEVPNAGLSRVRVQRDINGAPAPSLVFHARERL